MNFSENRWPTGDSASPILKTSTIRSFARSVALRKGTLALPLPAAAALSEQLLGLPTAAAQQFDRGAHGNAYPMIKPSAKPPKATLTARMIANMMSSRAMRSSLRGWAAPAARGAWERRCFPAVDAGRPPPERNSGVTRRAAARTAVLPDTCAVVRPRSTVARMTEPTRVRGNYSAAAGTRAAHWRREADEGRSAWACSAPCSSPAS